MPFMFMRILRYPVLSVALPSFPRLLAWMSFSPIAIPPSLTVLCLFYHSRSDTYAPKYRRSRLLVCPSFSSSLISLLFVLPLVGSLPSARPSFYFVDFPPLPALLSIPSQRVISLISFLSPLDLFSSYLPVLISNSSRDSQAV